MEDFHFGKNEQIVEHPVPKVRGSTRNLQQLFPTLQRNRGIVYEIVAYGEASHYLDAGRAELAPRIPKH